MADAGSAAKVCASCAVDVSNAPRTKDAQGRYFCKSCVEKLKAKAAKPAAPKAAVAAAPSDNDVMGKLLADSPGLELCPNCGGGITAGAMICVRCGYNKETGKAMKVQVVAAPREKEAKVSGSRGGFPLSPNLYLMALVLLVGGGFALSMFNPLFAALLYLICAALFAVAWIWGIVAAFKDGESLYGICGIAGFVAFIPWLAFVYYAIFATGREYLKVTMAAALIGLIAGGISISTHGTEIFGDLDDEGPSGRQRVRQTAPASDPAESGESAPAQTPAPSDGAVIGG